LLPDQASLTLCHVEKVEVDHANSAVETSG
jgi:hypothetical protein